RVPPIAAMPWECRGSLPEGPGQDHHGTQRRRALATMPRPGQPPVRRWAPKRAELGDTRAPERVPAPRRPARPATARFARNATASALLSQRRERSPAPLLSIGGQTVAAGIPFAFAATGAAAFPRTKRINHTVGIPVGGDVPSRALWRDFAAEPSTRQS